MSSSPKEDLELVALRAKLVGEFFRQARQKAGLSQGEIARLLSYKTSQFVSNWERGISLPPLNCLQVVSTACSVSFESVLDVVFDYQQRALVIQKNRLLKQAADEKR